jgi:hypothetical protein
VAEEGFVVRTRFVGDCATGRAELATYAEGLDFCPPRFLLTHFLKVARKLIHNTSSRMVLQYAHVLQRPYYSAENLDDGVWIRFRPGSGNVFHYVFQASVFFQMQKTCFPFPIVTISIFVSGLPKDKAPCNKPRLWQQHDRRGKRARIPPIQDLHKALLPLRQHLLHGFGRAEVDSAMPSLTTPTTKRPIYCDKIRKMKPNLNI